MYLFCHFIINKSLDEFKNYYFLTDDIYRLEQGLTPQIYDAFLLFADEDIQFAQKLVDRLENDQGLRVFY
jgi:hypothetical protein